MTLRTASLDVPLRAQPFPNHVYAEAHVLSIPTVEGGESSQTARREEKRPSKQPPLRLTYNKERLRFMTALSESIRRLHQDSEAWREYLADLEEWDNVAADGLTEDEPSHEAT